MSKKQLEEELERIERIRESSGWTETDEKEYWDIYNKLKGNKNDKQEIHIPDNTDRT